MSDTTKLARAASHRRASSSREGAEWLSALFGTPALPAAGPISIAAPAIAPPARALGEAQPPQVLPVPPSDHARDREAFLSARIDVLDLQLRRASAALSATAAELDDVKREHRTEAQALQRARLHSERAMAEAARDHLSRLTAIEGRLAETTRWARWLGRATSFLASRPPLQRRSMTELAPARPARMPAALPRPAGLEAQMRRIAGGRLFHAAYYQGQFAEGLPPGTNLLRHYLTQGWRAGKNPNPLFDVTFYRLRTPELGADEEPLLHYLDHGSEALRDPHPAFHTRHSAARCPSPKPAGTSWLQQFLRLDIPAVSPHPLFDNAAYAARAGLTQAHAAVTLLHYLLSGWRHELAFSPLFDAAHYRAQLDGITGPFEPYAHYVTYGAPLGLSPHPLFDPATYRQARKALDPRALDPLVDYVEAGEAAGATAHPLFDPRFYRTRFMSAGTTGTALEHYLGQGSDQGFDPHPDFDATAYRRLRGSNLPDGRNTLVDVVTEGLSALAWPDLLRGETVEARPPQPVPAHETAPKPAPEAVPVRHYPGKVAAQPGRPTVLVVAHAAGEHLFGSERSFLDMLDGLGHLPANVVVALPRNVPTYTNAIRALCQDVLVFDYRWWRKGEESSPAVRAAFRTIIGDRGIDAVHVNTIMLREPLQAARDCGIPGVVHVRELIGQDVALQELIGQAPDDIIAETKQRADWVIGNSGTTATAFAKPERTFVVPNAIDLDAMDLPLRKARETVRFGLISSNIPKKGLLDLVKLARLAWDAVPEAQFVIIGPETDLVRDLRHQQLTRDVPGNVVFAGYAASPAEAIAQLDVVLSLSHFAESFGRTVLEAMAARRPVIGYAWGAVPELIAHGETGYLVPFRKPEAALDAVRTLCRDGALLDRMGEAGRSVALARYGFDSYRQAFARAYARILPSPGENAALPSPGPVIRAARRPGLKTVEPVLRLAYFCWHFPVPSETFVLSELERLVATGVDVIVFCRQSPHKTFKPGFAIAVERVDSAARLAQRLRETGRTMVHAHFTYPTVTDMVWPACEAAEVPFTFMAHAQDIFRTENDRKNRLAEIGASPWCRALFTLSRFHAAFVTERGFPREKVIINPNAVDTARFAAARMPGRDARPTRRIIAIHRFVEKKGLDLLIRAAALVRDLDLTIDIYGYGEREDDYRDLVATLGLTHVTINGPLGHAEVVEAMRHADLFACPSVRAADGDMDGIPTSLVESMAAGLPVLTTDIAGIPELVVDGVTGIVASPTPEGLAAAIRRFYALPDLKLRAIIEAAQKEAVARHDVVRATRILERVWQNRTVDIVAVAWNNLRELKSVVESVIANTALPYHLIVCDNQSAREPVGAYLEALWQQHDRVTVIHNDRNAMVGPGTNLALDQGVSDTAIYICAKEGISFRRGWEAAFVHAFAEQPTVGLVGSIGTSPTYLHGAQYPTGIRLFPQFRNRAFATDNPTRVFGHVQGGLFGLRRAMVEAIGGFSEDVPHDYTDVEYSFYAESRGWALGEAPGVLALFNKSRPTLSQRFDEAVVVAHPVQLDEIARFQAVADGKAHHCNICDWFGPAFEADTQACPHCAADPADRSVQRWLSEGVLMYRRLPALCIGLSGPMEQAWSAQFQGPRLTLPGLSATLRAGGRLPNRPASLSLSITRFARLDAEQRAALARELRRLLAPEAVALFQIEGCAAAPWDAEVRLLRAAMAREGFVADADVRYASRAIGFTHVPMQVFRRG